MVSYTKSQADEAERFVYYTCRYVRIFSAKLVLEVFGGAGAVWGCSEALTLRSAITNPFWRSCALFAGFVFFIRFLLHSRDHFCPVGENSDDKRKEWVRIAQIFAAKLILEVCGGAGAVWGFSEVVAFRNDDTVWFWRPAALYVGFFFFCRWILQLVDACGEAKKEYDDSMQKSLKIVVDEYNVSYAWWVLEVLGCAGGICGLYEVVTLRHPGTVWLWRHVTSVIAVIFFLRFVLRIVNDVLEARYKVLGSSIKPDQWKRLLQIFSAKLNLEVFGGAGAIWGFSEVITLRNQGNAWFWRPAALIFGIIFLCRLCLQILDFVAQLRDANANNCNELCMIDKTTSFDSCDDDDLEDENTTGTSQLLLTVEYGSME